MREACLAWVYVRDVVFGAECFVYIAAIGDADIFSGIEVELRAALYHAKSLATYIFRSMFGQREMLK